MAEASFYPLFPLETEDAIRARWNEWANEGLTSDDPLWVDTRVGSHFQILTEPGVREAARTYDLMGTEMIQAAFARTAWGAYLDEHAFQAGLERLAATRATGEVRFEGANGTPIAAGTVVYSEPSEPGGDPVEFEVTAGGTIAGGFVLRPIRALAAGSAANLSSGSITRMGTPVPGVTVLQLAETVGGTEVETDAALLARIVAEYGAAPVANLLFYEREARKFAGVGDARALAGWNGPNTVLVVLFTAEGGPVASDVVSGFQAVIDPVPGKGQGLAPAGAQVTVQSAQTFAVNISAQLRLEEGYSIDGSDGLVAVDVLVARLLRDYIRTLGPGDEIVLAQVIRAIASVAGVHDVSVTINNVSQNVPVPAAPIPRVPVLSGLSLTEVA
jgi:uncharacterized phage protein gp47/JayE